MWRLSLKGQLDTISPTQLAYQQIDFSLARDKWGNEYYTKQFLKRPDNTAIYKKSPDGKESVFAQGNFKGVRWLHPQEDGSLLFVLHNNVYKALPNGKVNILAHQVANPKPSFPFSGNSVTVWGVWQDEANNLFVAAFSDQAVKKITPDGQVSIYHQSAAHWAPLYGVFDNQGRLWVLESSDENEIRVVQANHAPAESNLKSSMAPVYLYIGGLFVCGILLYFFFRNKKPVNFKAQSA